MMAMPRRTLLHAVLVSAAAGAAWVDSSSRPTLRPATWPRSSSAPPRCSLEEASAPDRPRSQQVRPPRSAVGGSSPRRQQRAQMLRTLCAAVRAGEWSEVNASLSAASYSVSEWRAMVSAAGQVNDWRGALSLLQRMEASTPPIAPDPAAYGHAISACTRARPPKIGTAMGLLDRLDARPPPDRLERPPEARSFNMVISGYAKGDWKKALTLLRAMPGRGTAPTTVSYNAALSGCSRAKR